MKIGILTFHRAHNYGAVLQCYALQEVLKHMGHEVEIIDYRQKWTEEVYKPFSFMVIRVYCKGIKSKIRYIKDFPKRYKSYVKRKNSFDSFATKFLSISSRFRVNVEPCYDAYVVGSDQLWNIECLGGQFDDVYLGNFRTRNDTKKVAYAISSNLISINYLNQQKRLLPSLNNFSRMSFRESAIIDKICEITGIQYPQCLDPTLLTDRNIWNPLLNDKYKNRKYVVCYQVRGNDRKDFSLIKTASLIARKQGWDVVNLSTGEFDVEDFVSAIAYAQYVVTTSFHATVFSIIFKRQYAAYLLHDGHDSRYEDLLNKLDCGQFLYEITEKPRINQMVDWKKIGENLNRLRESSLEYLSQSIY